MAAPGVIVLSGPPCSGKSSVGRVLPAAWSAAGHDVVHIEVDRLFDLLLPTSDRGRVDRMLAYDGAHAIAALAVERGRTVVLECTYARQEQRLSLLSALAAAPEAALRVVEFHVSPDEAVRRFRQRVQGTDLDERAVRERAAAFPYSTVALSVDSATAGPDRLAAELLARLQSGPPPVHADAWAAAGRDWT